MNWCWKCRIERVSQEEGLCAKCFDQIMNHMLATVGLVVYAAVSIFQLPAMANAGLINPALINPLISRLLMAMVIMVADAVFLIVSGVLLYLAYCYMKFLYEWALAFRSHLKEKRQERERVLQLEAQQRAKLAEPQRLDGQQLDALLTEEYMKKKGWDK